MRPSKLIVGLLAIGFAIAQSLAAAGKVRLDVWPFVRTEARWRLDSARATLGDLGPIGRHTRHSYAGSSNNASTGLQHSSPVGPDARTQRMGAEQ